MKKIKLTTLALSSLVLAACSSTILYASEHSVSYPTDYRLWTHLKSMVINDSHGLADPFEGIHHIYGNDKATEGLEKKSYEKGATFVFDLLKAERSKDATTEGDRKFIGVMTYDPNKFEKTGNWGFEAFAGDSKTQKVVKDSGVSCFQCHVSVEKQNFVFSTFRK